MWTLAKWVLESQIVRTAIFIATAILGVFAYNKAENWKVRREGRKEERERQEQADADNAKAIRNRVDAVKPSGLRPDDRRGYRD